VRALAGGVVASGPAAGHAARINVQASARPAGRRASLVAGDQHATLVAVGAVGWGVEDDSLAGGADRADRPACVDRPAAAAAAAGLVVSGPAGVTPPGAARPAARGTNPATGGADLLWAAVAAVAQVRAVWRGAFGDWPGPPAAAAHAPRLLVAAVARPAGRPVGPGHRSGSLPAADGAAVRGWRPTAKAQRRPIIAPGDRHPGAATSAAFLDDPRVGAVAAIADAALGSTGGDAGPSTAAPGAGGPAGVHPAHLADPPIGAGPAQVGGHLAAARAAGPDHGGLPGRVQDMGQADHHRRAARIPGSQRVRVAGEVLGQLPQRDALGGAGHRQHDGKVGFP